MQNLQLKRVSIPYQSKLGSSSVMIMDMGDLNQMISDGNKVGMTFEILDNSWDRLYDIDGFNSPIPLWQIPVSTVSPLWNYDYHTLTAMRWRWLFLFEKIPLGEVYLQDTIYGKKWEPFLLKSNGGNFPDELIIALELDLDNLREVKYKRKFISNVMFIPNFA